MKKIIFISLLFLVPLFGDRIVKDQLNREVKLPDKVERIVVLQHQSLNILVQIGASDKIVGVLESYQKQLGKDFVRLMPNIVNLPTPGDLKSINYESVLNLKPDVVIVTHYMDMENIKKLEEFGVPVVALSFFVKSNKGANEKDPEFEDEEFSYDNGLYEGIKLIGDVANRENKADELIKYIKESQKELNEVISKIDVKDRSRIYVANPDFTTYGKGKYLNIIFQRSGGENVAAKTIKGYKQITPEKLVEWNPDVIFVQSRYKGVVDEIKNDRALQVLNAVKNDKIYLMPEYAKVWGYPTPEAMAIGEFWVAKTLYPNEFKNFDLDKKVDEYYQKFYNFKYDGK